MNTNSEQNFKGALKELVTNETEKLSFFDVTGMEETIPPFVPEEETTERKQISGTAKRRRYSLGMAAAAACFVVFLCATIITYSSGIGADITTQDAKPPAGEVPGEPDDGIISPPAHLGTGNQNSPVDELPLISDEPDDSIRQSLPYLILAIISAAFFILFLIKKRRQLSKK